MEQAKSTVANDTSFNHINEDHKSIFNYIEKLNTISQHPSDFEYAISTLERFISFFLEHTIKEEQLLQQYLPSEVVKEHISLHQNELLFLDESLVQLKAHLSAQTIQRIAISLEKEFKNHIYRNDRKIIQQLIAAKNRSQSGSNPFNLM